jgi:hypothetical protein
METIDWDFAKNTRKDKCRYCTKTKDTKDVRVLVVKELKKLAWKQRRQVIIEKHKNPKKYILRGTFGTLVWDIREIDILDEEIEKQKKDLADFCRERNITQGLIEFVCLDEEKLPKELL